MEKTRPILYGVADYAEIRKANAWFVGRTAEIRDLEATRYAIFLRPRRFGSTAAPVVADTTSVLYERVYEINNGVCDFAEKGEWRGFVGTLSSIAKENFAVRDTVEDEKVVQSTCVALLTVAKGLYLVGHEREAGGGFYDIALKPRLDRWPDIAHAALIEMKYVKAGDPAPTKKQLEKFKKQASDQFDPYSADPALIAEWRLVPLREATGVSLPRRERRSGKRRRRQRAGNALY